MRFTIGDLYERTCAIVRMADGREYAIPVLGDAHADRQFGFPHRHYHIDGRFYMEPRMAHEYKLNQGHTAAVIRVDAEGSGTRFLHLETRSVACVELFTGLVFPATPTDSQQENLACYETWYASFLGKSCAGKRCPHFGTEMLEKDGLLICPLHELSADPETLLIVERS